MLKERKEMVGLNDLDMYKRIMVVNNKSERGFFDYMSVGDAQEIFFIESMEAFMQAKAEKNGAVKQRAIEEIVSAGETYLRHIRTGDFLNTIRIEERAEEK